MKFEFDSNDVLHFPIRKKFPEIFDFKPANFKSGREK